MRCFLVTRFTVGVLIFVHTATAQESRSEPAQTIPVRSPERWLELSMVAPTPMAVHPQGKEVVAAAGCTIDVYDLATGDKRHTWREDFARAQYSRDGQRLLTVRNDQVVVWDTLNYEEIRRFSGQGREWDDPDFRNLGTLAALSADGCCVAIFNRDRSFDREMEDALLIYDVDSGRLKRRFVGPWVTRVGAFDLTPDGRYLLARCALSRVKTTAVWGPSLGYDYVVWDVETGQCVADLPDVATARLSPDGTRIATAYVMIRAYWNTTKRRPESWTTMTVWNTATGEPLHVLECGNRVLAFTFSPDSRRLLAGMELQKKQDSACSYSGQLIEWDVRSGERTFETDSPKPFASVAYSPDGRRRFATTVEMDELDDELYRLCAWDAATDQRLPADDSLPNRARSCRFGTPSGATCSATSTSRSATNSPSW